MSYQDAIKLIRKSLNSLVRVGLLDKEVSLHGEMVLLGTGSSLDSIAFVTFVTDLEDRLSRETDQEIYLVLNEIHEFNADNPFLSAETLAQYMVKLTEEQKSRHG